MAESKSRARMRILRSWSLILDIIMSWYCATRLRCVGTILASAKSAMYFTLEIILQVRATLN
jgi:hypothetical protein